MNVISVKNLRFNYKKQPVLLANLSFEVAGGEFVAIVGPNGAGKTTLLNILAGQLKPGKGRLLLNGRKIKTYSNKELARKMAVVRQHSQPAFDFTVEQVVLMGRTAHTSALGLPEQADIRAAAEAMELTDTAQLAHRSITQLSQGQRQRVYIARALAQQSPLMLLDEPTSFLDLKHQLGTYELLKKLRHQQQKTIIAISHDLNLTAEFCDKVLLLGSDGHYSFGPCRSQLTAENIKRVFRVDVAVARSGRRSYFFPQSQDQ